MIILVLVFMVVCTAAIVENIRWQKYKSKGYSRSDYMIVTQIEDPMFVAYAGVLPEEADRIAGEIREKYGF